MINGVLVNPDFSHRPVSFNQDNLAELIGGSTTERVQVSFSEEGPALQAIVNQEARGGGGEPNPVASLGKNHQATGNSAFYVDPANAVYGPVLIVGTGAEAGSDITEEELESVEGGVRAAENYRQDQAQEYTLWFNAASNLA